MLSTTSRHRQQKHRQLSLLLVLLHLLRATSPKNLLEAKQAATERQRQRIKENKFVKKISKIIPAAWLGGASSSSSSSRGKYKPAPPASGYDDATGGFGGGGEGAGSSAAGPPGVGKKE